MSNSHNDSLFDIVECNRMELNIGPGITERSAFTKTSDYININDTLRVQSASFSVLTDSEKSKITSDNTQHAFFVDSSGKLKLKVPQNDKVPSGIINFQSVLESTDSETLSSGVKYSVQYSNNDGTTSGSQGVLIDVLNSGIQAARLTNAVISGMDATSEDLTISTILSTQPGDDVKHMVFNHTSKKITLGCDTFDVNGADMTGMQLIGLVNDSNGIYNKNWQDLVSGTPTVYSSTFNNLVPVLPFNVNNNIVIETYQAFVVATGDVGVNMCPTLVVRPTGITLNNYVENETTRLPDSYSNIGITFNNKANISFNPTTETINTGLIENSSNLILNNEIQQFSMNDTPTGNKLEISQYKPGGRTELVDGSSVYHRIYSNDRLKIKSDVGITLESDVQLAEGKHIISKVTKEQLITNHNIGAGSNKWITICTGNDPNIDWGIFECNINGKQSLKFNVYSSINDVSITDIYSGSNIQVCDIRNTSNVNKSVQLNINNKSSSVDENITLTVNLLDSVGYTLANVYSSEPIDSEIKHRLHLKGHDFNTSLSGNQTITNTKFPGKVETPLLVLDNSNINSMPYGGTMSFRTSNITTGTKTTTNHANISWGVSGGPSFKVTTTDSVNSLAINSSGQVGIGTNNPSEGLHVSTNSKFDNSITVDNSLSVSGMTTLANLTVTGQTTYLNVLEVNDLITEDRQIQLANLSGGLVSKTSNLLDGAGLKILSNDGNVTMVYDHNATLHYDSNTANIIYGPAWKFSENIALAEGSRIHTNSIQSSNIEQPLQFFSQDGRGLVIVQKAGHVGFGNLGINHRAPTKLVYARETTDEYEATARFAHYKAGGKAGIEFMVDDDANPGQTGGKFLYEGDSEVLKIGQIKNGVFNKNVSISNLGYLKLANGTNETSNDYGELRYNVNVGYVEVSRDNKWMPVGGDVNLFEVTNQLNRDTPTPNGGAIKIVNVSEHKLNITRSGFTGSTQLLNEENFTFPALESNCTFTFSQTGGPKSFRVRAVLGATETWTESPSSLSYATGYIVTVFNDSVAVGTLHDNAPNIYVSDSSAPMTANIIRSKTFKTVTNIENIYSLKTDVITSVDAGKITNESKSITMTHHKIFTPGTPHTFNVPSDTRNIRVAAIGGGGKGAESTTGGGGGGSGFSWIGDLAVNGADTLTINVGAGSSTFPAGNTTIHEGSTLLMNAMGGKDGSSTGMGGMGGGEGGYGDLGGFAGSGGSLSNIGDIPSTTEIPRPKLPTPDEDNSIAFQVIMLDCNDSNLSISELNTQVESNVLSTYQSNITGNIKASDSVFHIPSVPANKVLGLVAQKKDTFFNYSIGSTIFPSSTTYYESSNLIDKNENIHWVNYNYESNIANVYASGTSFTFHNKGDYTFNTLSSGSNKGKVIVTCDSTPVTHEEGDTPVVSGIDITNATTLSFETEGRNIKCYFKLRERAPNAGVMRRYPTTGFYDSYDLKRYPSLISSIVDKYDKIYFVALGVNSNSVPLADRRAFTKTGTPSVYEPLFVNGTNNLNVSYDTQEVIILPNKYQENIFGSNLSNISVTGNNTYYYFELGTPNVSSGTTSYDRYPSSIGQYYDTNVTSNLVLAAGKTDFDANVSLKIYNKGNYDFESPMVESSNIKFTVDSSTKYVTEGNTSYITVSGTTTAEISQVNTDPASNDSYYYLWTATRRIPNYGLYNTKDSNISVALTAADSNVRLVNCGKLGYNSETTCNYLESDVTFLNSAGVYSNGLPGRGSIQSTQIANEGGGGGAGGLVIGFTPPSQTTQIPGSGESGIGYGAGGGGSVIGSDGIGNGKDGILYIEYESSMQYKTDYLVFENTKALHSFTTPFGTNSLKILTIGGGSRADADSDENRTTGNVTYSSYTYPEGSTEWYGNISFTANVGRGGRIYDHNGSDSDVTGQFNSIDTKIIGGGANVQSGYSNMITTMNTVGNSLSSVNSIKHLSSYNQILSNRPEIIYGDDGKNGVVINNKHLAIETNDTKREFSGKLGRGYGAAGPSGGYIHKDFLIVGSQKTIGHGSSVLYQNTNDTFTIDVIGGDSNLAIIGNNGNISGGVYVGLPPNITSFSSSNVTYTRNALYDEAGTFTLTVPSYASELRILTVKNNDNSNIELKNVSLVGETTPAVLTITVPTTNTLGTVVSNISSVNTSLTNSLDTTALTANITAAGFVHNPFLNTKEITVSSGEVSINGQNAHGMVYLEWNEVLEPPTEMIQFQPEDGSDGLVYVEYTHLVPFVKNDTPVTKTVYNYGTGNIVSNTTNKNSLTITTPGEYRTVQTFPETSAHSYYHTLNDSVRDPQVAGTYMQSSSTRIVEHGDTFTVYNNGPSTMNSNTNMRIAGGSEDTYVNTGSVSLTVGLVEPSLGDIKIHDGTSNIVSLSDFESNIHTCLQNNTTTYTIHAPSPGGSIEYYYEIIKDSESTSTRFPASSSEYYTTTQLQMLDNGDKLTVFNMGPTSNIRTSLGFNSSVSNIVGTSQATLKVFSSTNDTYYDVYVNNKKYNTFNSTEYIPLKLNDIYEVTNRGCLTTKQAIANIHLDNSNELTFTNERVHFDTESLTVNTSTINNSGWGNKQFLQTDAVDKIISGYVNGTYNGPANKSFGFKIIVNSIVDSIANVSWSYRQDEESTDTQSGTRMVRSNEAISLIHGMSLTMPTTISGGTYYVDFDKNHDDINTDNSVITIKNSSLIDTTLKYNVSGTTEILSTPNDSYIYLESGNVAIDGSKFSSSEKIDFSISKTGNGSNVYIQASGPTSITRLKTDLQFLDTWHTIGYSTRMKFKTTDISWLSSAINFTLYPFVKSDNDSLSILDTDEKQLVSVDDDKLNIHIAPSKIWEYYHFTNESNIGNGSLGGIEARGYYTGRGDTVKYEIYPQTDGATSYFNYKVTVDTFEKHRYSKWTTDHNYYMSDYIPLKDNDWIALDNGIEVRFTGNISSTTVYPVDTVYRVDLKKKSNTASSVLEITKSDKTPVYKVDTDGTLILSGDIPSYKMVSRRDIYETRDENTIKQHIFKQLFKASGKKLGMGIRHTNHNSLGYAQPIKIKVSGTYTETSGSPVYFDEEMYYTQSNQYGNTFSETLYHTRTRIRGDTSRLEISSGIDNSSTSPSPYSGYEIYYFSQTNTESSLLNLDIEYVGPDNVTFDFFQFS